MEALTLERQKRSGEASVPGRLRLLQLGGGHWGVNLARNFSHLPGVRLTICDVDPERQTALAEKFPTVEVSGDVEGSLLDPGFDGVIVALPASLHHVYAKKALLAGKHVLVEKPLAMNSCEAQELVDLATERDLVLLVGHTFLYNDAVRHVKSYIDSGELGEIYYITSQRLNLGRVRQDVNALWNLAPHDISILLYWLDAEPDAVSAHGLTFLQNGIEDVVFADLRFPSGIAAHVHVSWLDPKKTRQMVIVGSKKMIVYDDASADAKIVIYDKGVDRHDVGASLDDNESFSQFQLRHRSGDILIPKIDFREPLQRECQHFVTCILERDRPLTCGVSGLKVVKVLERLQESLEASRVNLR